MSAGPSSGSLGGQPIVSVISALTTFNEQGWDTSSFFGLANSYTSRIGEDVGTGWLLMTAASLDNLNTANPHVLRFGSSLLGSTPWSGIYIRSAVRAAPGETSSPNTLYLVEIVDTKYHLLRKSVNRRYNCHLLRDVSSNYVTDTKNGSDPWTWEEIIEDLWDENHPLIGAFPTLPDLSDLSSTPENLRYEGVSAWAALNDVCRRVGCTVVFDNANLNKFYIVRLGAIYGDPVAQFQDQGGTRLTRSGRQSIFESDFTSRPIGGGDGLIWDAETLFGDVVVPENITVHFPTELGPTQADAELSSDYGKWYPVTIDGSSSAELPSTVAAKFNDTSGDGFPLPRPTFNGNSEISRYETMTARFASPTDPSPSNIVDLTLRAREIARDIYRCLKYLSPCHVAYQGIKYDPSLGGSLYIPGKCISSVTWADIGGGFRTDIRRQIPRLLPEVPEIPSQPSGVPSSSGSGGGSSGGGCGCCSCLDCLDLCDQDPSAVVQTCSACGSSAPRSFVFNPGSFNGYEDLGTYQMVNYVDECTWESDNITVSGGTYKWVLTQAGVNSTLVLEWVSGSDPLVIKDGIKVLSWAALPDLEWSCLCDSTLRASEKGEKYPKNLGLNCEICLNAFPSTFEQTCEYFDGCFNAGLSISPIDLSSCGGGEPSDFVLTVLPTSPSSFPSSHQLQQGTQGTGFTCNDHPNCQWSTGTDWPGIVYSATLGGSGDYIANVRICIGSDGHADLYVYIENGACMWFAGYRSDDPVIVGSNPFSLTTTSIEDGTVLTCGCPAAVASWPSSISIEATDCTFGALEPDVGYGCGGGNGDCSSACFWVPVVDAEGEYGYRWENTGGTGVGCQDCGGCSEPDHPAYAGGSATTYCVDA